MYVNDIDYQNEIKAAVKETIDNNINCNANTKWELIKGTIRNVSIKYSTRIIKDKERREKEIHEQIKNIQGNQNNNDSDLEKLNTLKQELNAFLTDKINEMILRSKAHYVENNGKKVNILQILKNDITNKKLSIK